MIVKLSHEFCLALDRQINLKYFHHYRFCDKLQIKPQVLSRQLNSRSIKYEFLINYLKELDMLPKSYIGFKEFDENFFIQTLPVKHREIIIQNFVKKEYYAIHS